VGSRQEGFSRQYPLRYKGEVNILTEVHELAEQIIREIFL
jgi:hypothetical protein